MLPLRVRTKDDASGVADVSARCRCSGRGDVEFPPLIRAPRRAFAAPAGGVFCVRVCVGLNGEGAREGNALCTPRADGGGETMVGGLRVVMFALLLTFALGRIGGGDRDVAGGLNGDAGRGLS